jgi:hypothetical protein
VGAPMTKDSDSHKRGAGAIRLARPCDQTLRRRECGASNQRANLYETAKPSVLRRDHSSGSAPTGWETRATFPWPMHPHSNFANLLSCLTTPAASWVRQKRRLRYLQPPNEAPTPTQMGAIWVSHRLKGQQFPFSERGMGIHARAHGSFMGEHNRVARAQGLASSCPCL